MNKLKAHIGLKVVSFGIWFYEKYPLWLFTEEDKENLLKLWEYHDEFSKALK